MSNTPHYTKPLPVLPWSPSGRPGSPWDTERRNPYTAIGIKRVPCVRCGKPANQQWNVCADKGRYRALCLACDIALNELVLRWANDPDWEEKMRLYRAQWAGHVDRAPLSGSVGVAAC